MATVKQGQTVLNVAIEQYGEAEKLFLLLRDNNISADEDLTPGQELVIRSDERKKAVTDYFELKSISVSNGENLIEVAKGIGTMIIETNFNVA